MAFPSGYRFNPTDEELVVDYLRNKILKNFLPCNIIKELNLYDYHPQQLYDMHKKEGDKFMYFFSPRDRKYPHGNRPRRQAGNGYWKASGVDQPVTVNNIKVASKRSLVYYDGNTKNSTKTNWIMYEYVMNQHSTPAERKPAHNKKSQAAASTSNVPPEDTNMRLDDWVLCKVYCKTHKSKNNNQAVVHFHQDNATTEPHIHQAASSGGASPIVSEPQMSGTDGGNYDHNVGDNLGVAPLIQQYEGVNLQQNLDFTGSKASIQRPHHNAIAVGYHNFAQFAQGTEHHYHHQYNLENYGGPILPPLPWIQPNYMASISTAVPVVKTECNATNYVGSTGTAPAVQGANVCENADAFGSANYVGDNFFGSTSSATPMQTMDPCNVAGNNRFFNSEPFVTEYSLDDSFLMLEDPNTYLDSFHGKKPEGRAFIES